MADEGMNGVLQSIAEAPPASPSDGLRLLRDAFLRDAAQLSPGDLDRFAAAALALLAGCPLLDRVAFAKVVSKQRRTPKGLLDKLMRDNFMVAAPVLEHAKLDDGDLSRMIETEGEQVWLTIARRSPLSVAVSDRLMAVGSPKVLRELAANVDAQLSPGTFEILSDQAVDDPEMDRILSTRPDLPPEIARKLYRQTELRTQKRVNEMIQRDRAKTKRLFVLR